MKTLAELTKEYTENKTAVPEVEYQERVKYLKSTYPVQDWSNELLVALREKFLGKENTAHTRASVEIFISEFIPMKAIQNSNATVPDIFDIILLLTSTLVMSDNRYPQ